MQALTQYRDVLLRDIASLDTATLDWQPVASAVSIGTGLLHIAAVEFLVMTSVALARDSSASAIDLDVWNALRPGFARELDEFPCQDKPLTHYLQWLERVRATTLVELARESRPIDLDQALSAVLAQLDLDPAKRDRLLAPLGLPFSVVAGAEPTSLVLVLIAHESYHRGQITQTAFRYRLQRDSNADAVK